MMARHHHHRHRKHLDGGEQGRIATDQLEVLHADEREAEEGEELHKNRHAPRGQGPVAEQPRVKQRMGLAQLPDDEADQQRHGER
jgi:hypothetical protein